MRGVVVFYLPGDLEQLSAKMVRETLEKKLGSDMSHRKEFIKATIQDLLERIDAEEKTTVRDS